MKKNAVIFAFLLLMGAATLLMPVTTPTVSSANGLDIAAKAAYLADADSGTVIYAMNENERLPIASMTKIMTSLLVFEAIEAGKLSYTDEITISVDAAGMGGSQVFLDSGSVHTVENLLKTVIVASANDSSVALAEAVAGSEGGFVALMNSRAKELGLENTNFMNCTGLPHTGAYSSAKDVSIMFSELLRHERYFEFSKIWLEDYAHPDGRITTITNTNKLVRFYNGCDAGKTGYTSEAKFCLAASAKRDGMRVISTVIGGENGKRRFKDVGDMMNYAFANYENRVLYEAGAAISRIEVARGKQADVAVGAKCNIAAFVKRGDSGNIDVNFELPDKIKAPVKAGDNIGRAVVVSDGVVIAEIDVVALEDVKKGSFGDSIKKILKNW